MKVWKKNLVAAAILVTVCAGIYVNWRYTEDQAAANLTDTLDSEKVMSDDSLVMVNSALEAAKDEAFRLGVSRGIDPFMTLSFMALPVIPSLRLTTRGVFDVLTQRYV